MHVIKRDGSIQNFNISEIEDKLKEMINIEPVLENVDFKKISSSILSSINENIKTSEIDELLAKIIIDIDNSDPKYDKLATRLFIDNIHKGTSPKFSSYIEKCDIIRDSIKRIVAQNSDYLDNLINNKFNENFRFIGINELNSRYLLKDKNKKVIERPQYLFMRLALEIHGQNMMRVAESYYSFANHECIHSTPTLFNACLNKNQLSACVLTSLDDDSIESIADILKETMCVSAKGCGVGLSYSKLRSSGSLVKSTNTFSNGIIPHLRMLDNVSGCIDQGGKRNASVAVYLDSWHADIFDFINGRLSVGTNSNQYKNIYTSIWHNNLFFERLKKNDKWTLFSPSDAPLLVSTYGPDFEREYVNYENNPNIPKTEIRAIDLMKEIIKSMIETGLPYNLNKDECMLKSNMKNAGTLQCSNLCTEITIPSNKDETGICVLASLNLRIMVDSQNNIDYKRIEDVTKILVRNLNNVIDNQYYVNDKCKNSAFNHRPIGIGIQGLADLLFKLEIPYEKSGSIQEKIAETVYYSAIEESMELAKINGSYSTFSTSPAASGILQPHMWGIKSQKWDSLAERVKTHGLRNAFLIAYMPTASTSKILGSSRSFHPYVSNIYTIHSSSGNQTIVNEYLVERLKNDGLWSVGMKNMIIKHNGSIQQIETIDAQTKELFKTAFEIKQSVLIDFAALRSPYVCQSQSLDLFISSDDLANTIKKLLFRGYEKRLKTLTYYITTTTKVDAAKMSTCLMCSN